MSVSHHDSVADHNTFKINLRVPAGISVNQGAGEVRDIHSTIGLPSDPEVITYEFWEPSEESFYSCSVITSSSALVINICRVLID